MQAQDSEGEEIREIGKERRKVMSYGLTLMASTLPVKYEETEQLLMRTSAEMQGAVSHQSSPQKRKRGGKFICPFPFCLLFPSFTLWQAASWISSAHGYSREIKSHALACSILSKSTEKERRL